MLVRNNIACPNCGVATTCNVMALDTARLSSKWVPFFCECKECYLTRTAMLSVDSLCYTFARVTYLSSGIDDATASSLAAQIRQAPKRSKVSTLNDCLRYYALVEGHESSIFYSSDAVFDLVSLIGESVWSAAKDSTHFATLVHRPDRVVSL